MEYARSFLEHTQGGDPVVFDRLHVGEVVYGRIIRGKDRVGGDRGLQLLEMLFNAKGAITVLCLPPYDLTLETWKRRQATEFVQKEEQFAKIYTAYHDQTNRFDLHYNYVHQGTIEKFLTKLNWKPHFAGNDLIGDPHSRVVFFGDRPNQELDLPFFATDNSSLFIQDCLVEAGYSLRSLLMGNCYTPWGSPRDILKGMNDISYDPRILVALGGKAETALMKVRAWLPPNTTIVGMQHPQYIKRFRQAERHKYVEHLKQLRDIVPNGTYRRYYI